MREQSVKKESESPEAKSDFLEVLDFELISAEEDSSFFIDC